MLVGWNLIDFRLVHRVLRTSKSETAVLLTLLFAALFLVMESAIYTGVLLSLMLYLNRTSKPN
ncbi:MAG: sodium-independent anion transporter, partial [Pseudomonadota bacterium]|nr:sodium-independent anion transporter [Pseudomonadota bacterium]